MFENVHIDNDIFEHLVRYCANIKKLQIGGTPTEFNHNITLDGIEILCLTKCSINTLSFRYCSKIGDKCVDTLCKRFSKDLKHFSIVRNFIEKVAHITDESIRSFEKCQYLESLEFVYTRKFKENMVKYLATYFTRLKKLTLKACPVQYSLQSLDIGCPNLEEVDFSGDSWVSRAALQGLSKHRGLRVLRMGHFEHSDTDCNSVICEYPPKGYYILGIFENGGFPLLRVLYFEENCALTEWVTPRINKVRKEIHIKLTKPEVILDYKGLD